MPKIELDVHTHTIASGHASTATITDMVKAAANKDLKLLGISDHGPATAGGGRASYFRNLAYAPKKRLHIDMVYGAETSILDDSGTLDIEDDILAHLDYTIASMHHPLRKSGTVQENTDAYIHAMQNPNVRIIGHCDDTRFPVDYPRLVRAAMKYHVLLEINNSSLRPDGYRGDTRFNTLMILNLCRHYHYPVLLSSDSHGVAHVGDMAFAEELVTKAALPDSLVMNYSAKAFTCFLARK